MKVRGIVKAFAKAGITLEEREGGHRYYGKSVSSWIEFYPCDCRAADPEASYIRVGYHGDRDELQSDYCAGGYYRTIKSAVASAVHVRPTRKAVGR